MQARCLMGNCGNLSGNQGEISPQTGSMTRRWSPDAEQSSSYAGVSADGNERFLNPTDYRLRPALLALSAQLLANLRIEGHELTPSCLKAGTNLLSAIKLCWGVEECRVN